MKPHREMTPQLVLEKMRTPPDGAMEKDGRPVGPAEDAAAKEALIRIAQDPKNINVHCVGCAGSCELLLARCCDCGGFVCPACVKVEVEGECHHDPPTLPSGLHEMENEDFGMGVLFEGPPPKPDTLTFTEALALIERYLASVDDQTLLGPSAVNRSMSKAQAFDLLLKALIAYEGDPLDVIATTGPTRIFLARNVMQECGFHAY